MSKKHFILLANYIRQWNNFETADRFSEKQIRQLAAFCSDVNPRFNRERWLDYIAGKCGPNGGAR